MPRGSAINKTQEPERHISQSCREHHRDTAPELCPPKKKLKKKMLLTQTKGAIKEPNPNCECLTANAMTILRCLQSVIRLQASQSPEGTL